MIFFLTLTIQYQQTKELAMSKNILFFPDMYQEQGHWLPVIALAHKLRNQPSVSRVEFMGILDCKAIVESNDENRYEGPINAQKYSRRFVYHEILKDEYPLGYTKSRQNQLIGDRGRFPQLWYIMDGKLDEVMHKLRPDLIVSGYFTALETLLMYYTYNYNPKYGLQYKPKFMITTTYLRHPSTGPQAHAVQCLLGMSEAMAHQIMGVYKEYYNNCNKHISLVHPDELTIYDFVKPLESMIEIVPCPRELDFDDYIFDSGNVKFIEPCMVPINLKEDDWKKNIEGIENIEHVDGIEKKTKIKKIIFATAGSQVQDYKGKAEQWFKEMIKMMGLQGMQDYHLVMSVGYDLIRENWAQKEALPGNVSVFPWVPQLDVLDFCVAAFVHGGLATIKECIYKNVPFIVVPLGKDQMDNALRVSRKGIGQIADAETSDYNEFQYLFIQAITNRWMKTKLQNMSGLFNNMEHVGDERTIGVKLILTELDTLQE
jgi:UDP:flavonoid glycosyltransferase YjiC (YdhE family)